MQKDSVFLKDRIGKVNSPSAVTTSAASASSGNLLKMQLLGPHPRPAGSATRGKAQKSVLPNSPGDSEAC